MCYSVETAGESEFGDGGFVEGAAAEGDEPVVLELGGGGEPATFVRSPIIRKFLSGVWL